MKGMHHHKKVFSFILQHISFLLSYSSIIYYFSTFWSQTAKINIMIILQLSIQGNITTFTESMPQFNPVYHIHTIFGQKLLFPKIGLPQVLNVANFQTKYF